MKQTIRVRPYQASDRDTLVAMNATAVPATNLISAEELEDLVSNALICLVAEKDDQPVGFVLCLKEGADYQSSNYRWISGQRERFAYVDRICVDETTRGQKIGEKLYHSLIEALNNEGRNILCEVNERPPNPGSLKFHKRLGFQEIGRADHGEKAVIFLELCANESHPS